jgi:formylglycine-generating enzyme required for sulfatase activity
MPQAANQPPGIFISYRRDDSAGHAGRLFDRLGAHFGVGQVFMDLERMEPGEDFVQVIEKAVGSCEILVALIGRSWLASRDEVGRRLENPSDFVRLEIATALARGVRVIPVLLQGAQMPRPQDLPEDLRRLSNLHALELSDLRWKYDVDQLTRALEKMLARRPRPRDPALWEGPLPDANVTAESEETAPYRRAGGGGGQSPAADFDAPAEVGAEASTVPLPVASASGAAPTPPGEQSSRTCLVVVSFAALGLILLVVGLAVWQRLGQPDGNVGPALPTPTPTSTPGRPLAPVGMVYVPGGEFQMGSDEGDEYERPAHTVSVRPFFIDRYEVTNQEYAQFVKAVGHRPPPTWRDGTYPDGEARHPVTGVSWDDAGAYANWAGKRLPTEEEWEFAARGTDGRRYPWGDVWRAGLANADGASRRMADVGEYGGASPFGAFDMVGNAWEWTESGLKAYPGGRLPEQPAADAKVLRGGSYKSNRTQATATYRFGWRASGEPSYSETGFRCVMRITNTPAAPPG